MISLHWHFGLWGEKLLPFSLPWEEDIGPPRSTPSVLSRAKWIKRILLLWGKKTVQSKQYALGAGAVSLCFHTLDVCLRMLWSRAGRHRWALQALWSAGIQAALIWKVSRYVWSHNLLFLRCCKYKRITVVLNPTEINEFLILRFNGSRIRLLEKSKVRIKC